MKISAYQMAGGMDYVRNLERCRHAAYLAAQAGAKLLVLPEGAMFLRAQECDETMVQTLDGEFVQTLAALSKQYALTIVAGMFEPAPDGRAYNTLVALQAGCLVAQYRKLHLYDAFDVQESARITAGDALPPVFSCEGVSVGLMTCYDVRFPETARALALQGAEVIALPAAWFAGAHKEYHWQLLCAARALENGVYVLGAGMCGGNRIGQSLWVDALGIVRAQLGQEEGLLCAEVDWQQLQSIRQRLPLLRQRRFEIALRSVAETDAKC